MLFMKKNSPLNYCLNYCKIFFEKIKLNDKFALMNERRNEV